jgi:uncharacterized protein (DUF305 family)
MPHASIPRTAPTSFRWLAAVACIWSATSFASGPAPDRGTARYELDFMEDMAEHHMMAVDMSTMCEEKAVHESLRELCTQMKTAQTAEIAMLQSWLSSWYGDSFQPAMGNGMMNQMKRLAGLSGEEFESAFMEMMIKHHLKGVREASQCMRRAYHEELRDFCQQVIDAQTEEIEMMQMWLCEWYSTCRVYGRRPDPVSG